MCKRNIFLIIQVFFVLSAHAQLNTEEIQLAIKSNRPEIHLHYPEYTKEFYKINDYNYAWLNNPAGTQSLLQLLNCAEDLGLNKEEYQFDLIQSIGNRSFIISTHRDSLITEVCLTDAAIHFFIDIAYGNRKPALGYNGLKYIPDCFNIPALLAGAIADNKLAGLVNYLEPGLPGYKTLKDWLAILNQSVNDSSFNETKIISPLANSTNLALIQRLYYLGIIDTLNKKVTDAYVKGKVRSAQRLFNLADDGILHKKTLNALNRPVRVRIEELKAAMNTVRWIRCISNHSPIFVVNIPSANLLVVQEGKVLMQTKVVVGKLSTPTPTLASIITDVILYPYWVVPNKIATLELLPLIQRNPGYLAANNMQVLNKAGKIVSPGVINWKELSSSWFPYTLRQSTGCDNSLGVVKLNFYSPYGVYLHDTPWKVLFNFNNRYFSHGCMRVEKAIELAHFLLKENTVAIDTLEEKGCILNQAPVPVPVKDRVPVFVLYNTAWFDSTGIVQFSDDVYLKLKFN